MTVSISTEPMRSRIARSIRSKPDAVLVLHQFTDRTHSAVAEIVDVVDLAAAVLQIAQRLDGLEQVVLAQHAHRVRRVLDPEAHVHLHPADRGQVVAVAVEEQAAEQRFRRLRGRRLTRRMTR